MLETGFGGQDNPDAEPVSDVVRAAISRLDELGVSMTRELEIADLAGWIDGTSVYVKQSKADINDFLAQRPDAPVSSFMEIYDGGHFHPENDLFHGIAEGPETIDGDVEYLQRRLNQEHFRRYVLNIFAAHGLDFLVYPTVQVIPPTRAGTRRREVPVPHLSHQHRDRLAGRAPGAHDSGRLHPRRLAGGTGAVGHPAGRGEDAPVRALLGESGGAETRARHLS